MKYAFLHEEVRPRIIPRDIKASNILLDKDLTPKIADFGLAKLFPDNVTHVSTRVAGTIGYLAPEYTARGRLTRKADVFLVGNDNKEDKAGGKRATKTINEFNLSSSSETMETSGMSSLPSTFDGVSFSSHEKSI